MVLCDKTNAVPAGVEGSTTGAPREASKDVKDAIQKAKEAKKSKKNCARDCSTKYEPVCVHDPINASYKPRTFGSQCAMEVQNCEMGTSEYNIRIVVTLDKNKRHDKY